MKTRLTITLSESLLKKVDQLIDKQTIRNRSHAIEHVLSKTLQPTVNQAIILAGGKKKNENVLPLTTINKKPLILNTIEHFSQFGITSFVIATNKHGKIIEQTLGDGSAIGVTITYVYEDYPMGTGGAIKNCAKNLHKSPFLVTAGDILTTINLHDFIMFHQENKGLVTIAVKPRPIKETYDNVFIQGNNVVNFQPSTTEQEVGIVNTGIYIFEYQTLKFIPYAQPSMLETDIFPKLSKDNKMKAFTFQGIWYDVDTDHNYKKLELE